LAKGTTFGDGVAAKPRGTGVAHLGSETTRERGAVVKADKASAMVGGVDRGFLTVLLDRYFVQKLGWPDIELRFCLLASIPHYERRIKRIPTHFSSLTQVYNTRYTRMVNYLSVRFRHSMRLVASVRESSSNHQR
jgi:hypothetical protein